MTTVAHRHDDGMAELLRLLEEAGAATPTSLDLTDPTMPYERFEAICRFLGRLSSAVKWYIGDLLIFGETVYGELAFQAAEALNMSPEGKQECIRVAMHVPRSRRNETLSWSHHRIVAPRWVTPQEQRVLLAQAEQEGMSTTKLRDVVQSLKHAQEDSGLTRESEPLLLNPPRQIVVEALVAAAQLVSATAVKNGSGYHVPIEEITSLRVALGEEER